MTSVKLVEWVEDSKKTNQKFIVIMSNGFQMNVIFKQIDGNTLFATDMKTYEDVLIFLPNVSTIKKCENMK